MFQLAMTALLWFGAVGCGLMAGVYFTFSAFVMTSLGRIAAPAGMAAMQSINEVIVRSLFGPLFFGTSAAALALAVMAALRWGQPGSAATLAGGLLYVVGMFGCTVVFNVPLNNALEAVQPGSASAGATWAHYLKVWTAWNHVRTVASIGACALFIAGLITSPRG